MGARRSVNVRRRQLARRMRAAREQAGLSLEQAAPELDFSTSTLSRMEMAQQVINVHAVRSMCDLYNIAGQDWTELVEMARAAHKRGWWKAYGVGDDSYVSLEAEATLVRDFTICYAPGLLQTADYARAIFQTSLVRRTEAELEDSVTVRMIRQKRLTSREDPLELVAILDETALHRPVGGSAVMAAQLAHLIEAAALPSVTLQVLPTGVGAHVAMSAVFTVLSFDHLGEPDIAYVEHPMGSVHVEKEAEVVHARLAFDRLRSDALSPADSMALIRKAAERY